MRYLLLCALGLACLTLPSYGTTRTEFWWLAANAAGWLACLLFIVISVFGARGRPVGAGYAFHRDLGFLGLALLALHVVLFLLDPTVWRYLQPGAPAWMWAGLGACMPLALLGWLSTREARRRWLPGAGDFRGAHLLWTAVALLLILWHVLGAGFYLRHWAAQAGFGFLCAALPLAAVLRRQDFRPAPGRYPNLAATAVAGSLLLAAFLLPRLL